ncbi:hypothetical protein BH09SUM1_BH09SUM1_15580 [soil metagenome]
MFAKPAFPAWVRRLDPNLAAEDTNEIFRAFRLRRTEHGRRRWRMFNMRGRGVSPGYVIGCALIVLVTLPAFYTCSCFALFIPIVGMAILTKKYSSAAIKGDYLPPRVSQVFQRSGFFENAAIDLWMTGASGQTVAEAIYLEHREAFLQKLLVSLAIFTVFSIGIYETILYLAHAPLPIHAQIVLPFWLYMLYRSGLYGFASHSGITRAQHLDDQFEYWKGSSPAGAMIGRGLVRAVIGMAVFVSLGLIFWAMIAINEFIMPAAPNIPPLLKQFHAARWFYYAAGILAALSGVFYLAQVIVQNIIVPKVQPSLMRAQAAYQIFMAGKVSGDPEGEAWARWRYAADELIAFPTLNKPPQLPRT